MKSMRWPLENGLELAMENDGDELTFRVSNGEVLVREAVRGEVFASFEDVITDHGARVTLVIQKEGT